MAVKTSVVRPGDVLDDRALELVEHHTNGCLPLAGGRLGNEAAVEVEVRKEMVSAA